MSNHNFIQTLLSQTWQYRAEDHCLMLQLGDSESLAEYGVILKDNYLDPDFKQAIIEILGTDFLKGLEGSFGDEDIFSGIDAGERTVYFVKLYKVTEDKLALLKSHLQFDFEVEII